MGLFVCCSEEGVVLNMAVARNPFLCGSDMCWLKEAEEEGRISFRHYMAAPALPECTNGLQSYKDAC